MTTPTPIPEALLEHLRQGESFVISSHVNPDGDAIGSGIGLSRILRKLGKRVVLWYRDPAPAVYSPLPDSASTHVGDAPPEGFPEAFDAAIVLECPELDRTGLETQLPELPMLNIDHHLGNQQYGAVDWIDTNSPAVGEMVYRLAKALAVELDHDTANALYLTLVTDTGGFRFSNTNATAFDAAAALVREGASPETISHWLYESQPVAALRLVGEMLSTLELHADGRIATAWLTRDMVERSGAQPGDSEGLIDYPRSIAGVDIVALFRQLDDGGHKVSLRSRGPIDIQQVARRNGGGGHQNAAGFSSRVEGPDLFDTTVRSLIEVLS